MKADIIENLYGHHYSRTTISTITQQVEDMVHEFHTRTLSPHYTVIYADATYVNIRRDTVHKEAIHFLIGITPEGHKEILDYGIYPSESVEHYKELFYQLTEYGLDTVQLVITDGLSGIKDAIYSVYPTARYQTCWVHVVRQLAKKVRRQDRQQLCDTLRMIYTSPTKEQARQLLQETIQLYQKVYPKVSQRLIDMRDDLLTYYDFPRSVRSSIYTTNLIESFHKQFKKEIKQKEQFPTESSLDRYVCLVCCEYNQRFHNKVHKGFGQACYQLEADIENMKKHDC